MKIHNRNSLYKNLFINEINQIKFSKNPSNLVSPIKVNLNQMEIDNKNQRFSDKRLSLNKNKFHGDDNFRNNKPIQWDDSNLTLKDDFISTKKSYIRILISPNFTKKFK